MTGHRVRSMRSATSAITVDLLVRRLALAAVSGDALEVRATVQELSTFPISELAMPEGLSPLERCVAAGIVELLAVRSDQAAPDWVHGVGKSEVPFFLVRSAHRMANLRDQCQRESPEPLRKRNLFAPANYLTWR